MQRLFLPRKIETPRPRPGLGLVRAALRTLLTEQLVEAVWPAEASLKQVIVNLVCS